MKTLSTTVRAELVEADVRSPSFRAKIQNPTFKLFSRIFAIFGMLMMFIVSGWGETPDAGGQCSSANTVTIAAGSTIAIIGESPNSDLDFYKVSAPANGTLSITTSSPNNHDYHLAIGSTCTTGSTTGEEYYSDTTTQVHTVSDITISSGATVYFYVKETGNDTDQYRLNLTFTASTPAPEVNVQGANGVNIVNNDNTPSTADYTDFGNVNVGSFSDLTFDIQNLGTAALTIVNPTLTGEFSLQTPPATLSIAAGGHTTFVVRFTPTIAGLRAGSISFANNDTTGGEDPYHFSIQGIGVAQTPPIMGNVPNQSAIVGTAFNLNIASYVALTNGDAILPNGYTLTGTLPAGLFFNNTTGVISGTPTAETPSTSFIVTASDNDGVSNTDLFTITVTTPTAPSGGVPDQYLSVNTAMTALDLATYFTSNAGAITYPASIAGLPVGLTYSGAATHKITGTPTAVTVTTSYTISVSNSIGATSDTFTITVYPKYSDINIREFSLQRQDNIYGDMQIIGNSVKAVESNGTCAPNGTPNNNIVAVYTNLDPTGNFNSTSADLKLPIGVDSTKIQYAYLYWQGRTNSSALTQNGKTMKLKAYNAASYTTVTSIPSKFNWNGKGDYQGVADVTDQIKASIDTVPLSTINSVGYNYPLWAADVYAPSSSDGKNDFGAWSMVVVYKNPDVNTKFRSVTLFDGYLEVFSSDKAVTLNGFLTPKTGLVDAKFIMFGGEGDISYSDGLTLTNNATPTPVAISLPNAPGTPAGTTSVWGSSEDINGVNVTNRNPKCQNTIGIDMRTFSVGTSSATSIIGNNQTSTTVTLKGTGADQYFPGVFAFSTELYMPQLCYDYSLKQDGRFLSIDRSNPIAQINQAITSSPLELTVYLRNKEADMTAQSISLKADLNASRFDYTMSNPMYVSNPNGSALIDRGVPANNSPANCTYDMVSGNAIGNQGCVAYLDNNLLTMDDDQRRIRKGVGSLGSEQYIYNKFILQPKAISGVIGDVNESLGLTIDYQITAGGVTMPYTDYVLGSSTVGICTPSAAYLPTWGLFNVVQHGQVQNNLKTQIARKPFDVDVIYDNVISTGVNDTPSSPVNTTVQVEMIDVDSFGDINASCANPDAGVSEPIIVPITFTPDPAPAYQTLVTPQDSSYHNFALKNGAYRVWYFTETNGTLIQNWTAMTDPNSKNKTVTGINGLFNSTSHGDCNASCAPNGSALSQTSGCFSCMKNNYGKPLCSRDNFSVRPEAFDIRIKDYDGAGVNTDLSHDVYGTAPDKNATTIPATLPRINLAAGYDYKYDINATGTEANVSGLTAVPRYTRYFNGPRSDYNITMMWDSPLTNAVCNDVAGRSLSFFIANGMRANQQEHLDQVGDYRLNMIDTSWTAVDQAAHIHTINNGFDAGTDCLVGNNDTGAVAPYGCDISSQHINGSLQYKDQNMNFKPAQFGLPFSYSLGKTVASTITAGGQGFVYMSDLNNTNDMNMSVRSTGQIRALGADGVLTTNFVGGCFAKDLNVTAIHDANLTYTTSFVTRMINSTIANVQAYDSSEVAQASNWIGTVDDTNFTKADNGALVNTIRFNFDRNQTTPHDPQTVTYSDINVTCTLSADCNQSSIRNSTPNTAVGSSAMDFNVTHTYGRVIAKDQRVMGLIAFDGLARYEVYKTDHIFGTLLTVDPDYGDWYINTLHNELTYGDASVTVVDPTTGSSLPNILTSTYGAGIETYKFNAFTVRQGYKAHIDTEGWLWNGIAADIYKDPVNPVTAVDDCDNHPCFNITFGRIIGNTGSAKTESENAKANKNLSSGTGWHSTSEYAPSVR